MRIRVFKPGHYPRDLEYTYISDDGRSAKARIRRGRLDAIGNGPWRNGLSASRRWVVRVENDDGTIFNPLDLPITESLI